MASIPRPPPAFHADTLLSLTHVTTVEPTQPPRVSLARRHGIQTLPASAHIFGGGWNRQSIRIFADFNDFESPRGSRAQRRIEQDEDFDENDEDYPRTPATELQSSANSVYSLDKALPEPPYHVFSIAKKKQLVYIVSLAGLFSPLSSNIYFPALGQISSVCTQFY